MKGGRLVRSAILSNKKLIIATAILAALFVVLLFIQQLNNQSNPKYSKSEKLLKPNNIASIAGGDIQQTIDRTSVKANSIDEARKLLPYDFPVPIGYKDHELTGIYVENNRTLYLRYGDAIYVIYHALPIPFDPNIDDTLSKRPDLKEVRVRGYRGIAGEPGKAKGSDIERVGGELIWYEKGLDIAIYNYNGTRTDQLMKLANAMRWVE